LLFFFSLRRAPRHLHSFPTRRSSDLHGILLDPKESEQFFNALLQKIGWYNDKSIVFGKEIITKRKVAWYGSKDFSYTYSGVTRIDRKSTRLNSSHVKISYAVFCLKKK